MILLAGTTSLCYRFEDIVSVSFWDKSGQNQCFIFQQEVIACLLKAVHLLYLCYSSALKAFVSHFLGLYFYFAVFFYLLLLICLCMLCLKSMMVLSLSYKFSGISFLYLHTWVNFEIWPSIMMSIRNYLFALCLLCLAAAIWETDCMGCQNCELSILASYCVVIWFGTMTWSSFNSYPPF